MQSAKIRLRSEPAKILENTPALEGKPITAVALLAVSRRKPESRQSRPSRYAVSAHTAWRAILPSNCAGSIISDEQGMRFAIYAIRVEVARRRSQRPDAADNNGGQGQ